VATPTPLQPTPLRESTRRFLRPIVGIDPASVRLYRGTAASEVTAQLGVEGVNIGDAIALGPGHEDESSPATLGLLAHELSHAARRQDTQYVPPAAQDSAPPAAGEEQIARSVERRATAAARRFLAPAAAQPPGAPGQAGGPGQSVSALPVSQSSEWGGLPAPWEPLPEWSLNAPADPMPAAPAANPFAPPAPDAAPAAPAAVVLPATAPAVAGAGAPLFAEADRGVTENEQPQQQPQQQQQPGPDLDALARQVYDRLKQRLAAERRRLS
jgi:hypothetical protein